MTRRPSRIRTTFAVALLLAGAAARLVAESATATGDLIEYDGVRGVAVISGRAVIKNSSGTLNADKIVVDLRTQRGQAAGRFRIVTASGTIEGDGARYDATGSTGTVYDAAGTSPPWLFKAERMDAQGPGRYLLVGGYLTTCPHDPPHYVVRSTKARMRMGDKAQLYNARLVIDETPVLWLPYYSRRFRDKKYTFRIEPGRSARDGFTARTIFGYPFTPNTFTKFRWDFLERTGDGFGVEHRYSRPDAQGYFDSYFIEDVNPDPQPEARRFGMLWTHYQRVTNRLTVNSRLDYKSDKDISNQFRGVGNGVLIENSVAGLQSKFGLNYQFSKAALQADMERKDQFSSATSSKAFVSYLALPRLSVTTIPLQWRYFPLYTSFAASYTNETVVRTADSQTLRYQRTGTSSVNMNRDIRLSRSTTLIPRFGFSETWQDRDFTQSSSEKDLYVGRHTEGADVRQRITRWLDATVGYTIQSRLQRNSTRPDTGAADRGIETEQVTGSLTSLFGRSNRVTLSGGYDLRSAPRNDLSKYRHSSARYTPPSLDFQTQLGKNVALYFRETYGLYDTTTRQVSRAPLNSSGELQFGDPEKKPFFSQGYSYTKNTSGAGRGVLFYNRLHAYVSPKWYVDLYVSYRATGPGGIDFRKAAPVEKTLTAIRDMHCWVFRMTFSDRPGRREAFFYIDLKTDLRESKNPFLNDASKAAVFRQSGPSDGDVFPADPAATPVR